MAPLLSTAGLTVTFGGLRAVDDVDLTVEEGTLVGLIGPNGAGKTTLLDAVGGFVPATGEVRFAGRALGDLPPHQRARLGVARTWQAIELFDDLTVQENLEVAAHPRGLRRRRADVAGTLSVLGIDHLAARVPSALSHSERKLVGVARAVAAGPRLICMDEPAAGLDAAGCFEFGRRLQALVGAGTSILLVDHDMGLVLSVCNDLYVLEFGRIIAHGSPGQVRADERVIAAYLGGEVAASR